MKIHFIKKAAFVYDLGFLFYLYFNKEECISEESRFFKPGKHNMNHMDNILSMLPPIPQELQLFFYKNDYGRIFFTWQFFHSKQHLFLDEQYDLSTVIEMIATQKEEITSNLFRYYFDDENITLLNNQEKRILTINQLIQKSTYNCTLKNSLYAFFIDPEGVWNTLQKQLTEMAAILTKYYKENTLSLQKLTHGFQYETTLKSLKYISNQPLDDLQHMYVSFTLCNSYLHLFRYEKNKVILFLGASYPEIENSIIKQSEAPDLLLLGNILCDNNRLQMIDYIASRKEVSVKDIQKQFGFTAANSYYHLNKMQDAGMLLTRNQGRIVLYRINHIYFQRLSNISGKYGHLSTLEPI